MSAATPNVAASVRARLLNVAKAQGVDFNQVLVRFALERILYRLTQSPHADRFVLKGALLFTLWYDMPHRATLGMHQNTQVTMGDARLSRAARCLHLDKIIRWPTLTL